MIDGIAEIRFADLMRLCAERQASDVHLVPGSRPALRVDGRLEFVEGEAVCGDETSVMTARFLDERSRARLRAHGDVTVAGADPVGGRLRVHAHHVNSGICLAVRLLPNAVPQIEALDLPPIVQQLARIRRGLILFTGPTGSGKSTSLAALIGAINQAESRHIMTIEDPIEYQHQSHRSLVSQREVGRDVSCFADAVLGALRSDPDVIMIGEMRDVETMRAAITAAETGHLVLSTLHTGDAIQTIDRIVDAFAGNEQSQVRAQLASTLVATICQRLVGLRDRSGRHVAAEVMIATDAVKATIREARTHQLRNLIVTGRQFGMQTLEHHLKVLRQEGLIDDGADDPKNGAPDALQTLGMSN